MRETHDSSARSDFNVRNLFDGGKHLNTCSVSAVTLASAPGANSADIEGHRGGRGGEAERHTERERDYQTGREKVSTLSSAQTQRLNNAAEPDKVPFIGSPANPAACPLVRQQ